MRTSIASIVPFLAGVALALAQRGSIRWGVAAAGFAAIVLIEVVKNAVHDGSDGDDLVDRLLTDHDLVLVAWIAFLAAGVAGLEVTPHAPFIVLLLAAPAAVKRSTRGLGELAVFAMYGPGIVLGTLLVLDAAITFEAVLMAIAVGLFIVAVARWVAPPRAAALH